MDSMNKRLNDLKNDIDQFLTDAGFYETEFQFNNWEANHDGSYNYRGHYAEPLPAIEHAIRRGPHMEIMVRVQVGQVGDFPEDVAEVKRQQELKEKEREIRERHQRAMEAELQSLRG